MKQDLRYALRALNRARGFALTAILVTALGIGANTAAFSVADFVLLRPLPFANPDALVRLCEGPRTGGGWGCNNQMTPANYRDLKAMNTSFEAMGAFANDAVNLVGGGEPRRLASARVTPEVLPLLGVAPVIGRLPSPTDLDTAVISHGLWQSQFGGSEAILGQKINLNGAPYTVIGVMPSSFYFPIRDVQLWTPLVGEDFTSRNNSYLEAVSRLKTGTTFEQARSELGTIMERLARDYPVENADTGLSFFRMRDTMSPRFRVMLLSLGGASICLLLLACANLANLLLARAATQERELAVRAALGAGRGRLIRQLLAQGVVIAVIGGAIGLVFAVLTLPLYATLVPPTLPVATQPGLDLRVLLVAALFTSMTALGFSLLPALRAGRTGFAALKDGSRAGGGRKQGLRSVLVALEVAMSVILLISAGLLIRAAARVQAIDPGFVARDVLTLKTALPRPKYDSPLRRREYYDRVLAGVRALPGVEGAAFITGLPMVVTGLITGIEIPGQDPRAAGANSAASHRWVTSQYFRTMGIPLHRGRDIEDTDSADRAWVAVVSGSFAERHWPGQDAIGKTFRHRGRERTVVGIVGDVKVRGLERTNEPQIYVPAAQAPDQFPAGFDPKDLVIRHTGRAEPLLPAIRRIVSAVDPDQPISNVRTMEEVLGGDTASRRAQLQVLAVLAVVAVVLAGVGIYGLLAYTVTQRSQEIGVRLALGAHPARVGRMIVGDGLRLALIGLVPGVLGAYAAARWMSALLFGVAPSDPLTFGGAAGLVVAIAAAGSALPALRAVRVSPMSVLRSE